VVTGCDSDKAACAGQINHSARAADCLSGHSLLDQNRDWKTGHANGGSLIVRLKIP
jgi:hypothetical protein